MDSDPAVDPRDTAADGTEARDAGALEASAAEESKAPEAPEAREARETPETRGVPGEGGGCLQPSI